MTTDQHATAQLCRNHIDALRREEAALAVKVQVASAYAEALVAQAAAQAAAIVAQAHVDAAGVIASRQLEAQAELNSLAREIARRGGQVATLTDFLLPDERARQKLALVHGG